MGGIIETVLDLKIEVKILQKRLEKSHIEEAKNITGKKIVIDAIVKYTADIKQIDTKNLYLQKGTREKNKEK